MASDEILRIRSLNIQYHKGSHIYHAVKDFDLEIYSNQILGLAGESGSGKSSLARGILNLIPDQNISGEILYNEINLLDIDSKEIRRIRGAEIALIFQEPFSAFNPVYTIGEQISEACEIHQGLSNTKAKPHVIKALLKVGLEDTDRFYKSYPHEVSGGELQRAAIAMAIINDPKIIIADEITTALDNLTQREIIELLKGLKKKAGITIMIISHDLALLSEICDSIAVMQNGRLMESGNVREVLYNPKTHYTKELIKASIQSSQNSKLEKSPVSLLSVKGLKVQYSSKPQFLSSKVTLSKAVNDVSFEIRYGEALGIIGESGSGKTSIARAIIRLIDNSKGEILFEGENVTSLGKSDLRKLRRKIQLIFQNPDAALDPHLTVAQSISEVIEKSGNSNLESRVSELLQMVQLDENFAERLPKELSGGEKQRVCIARALALNPILLICDEPVTSLDSSIKKEILALLNSLREKLNLSLLFISHDLNTVSSICQRIIVLKDGEIVEADSSDVICNAPKTDYTRKLLESTLSLTPKDN